MSGRFAGLLLATRIFKDGSLLPDPEVLMYPEYDGYYLKFPTTTDTNDAIYLKMFSQAR